MATTTSNVKPFSTKTEQALLQPWHKAFTCPAKAFSETPLQIIAGRIPVGLQGTFYQNGTGRLKRGGTPVGHWFDGDGAVLRLSFDGEGATATYRYVETQGYLAEQEAGRFLYGNYGRCYPGPLWKHVLGLFSGQAIKNSANTAVLALPNKLLALWEAGNPHSLDLETLETIGLENLGWLKTAQAFSAHPLRDPASGEIYSIGVSPRCELSVYRCRPDGSLIKQRKIVLNDVPLVHSFVIAGRYLVFLVSPVVIDALPLLLNQKPYADALNWDTQRGTRVVVVDRESLEVVAESDTEAWFQWHFGNGCVEPDGSVRLNYVRFGDFTSINELLREVPTGQMTTKATGRLWQLRLNPLTGEVLSNDCVLNRDCEFPQVPASKVGQQWRYTYVLMHRDGMSASRDWFGAIGRVDGETGALLQTDLGEGCYGSEPLHVCDVQRPGQGWLIVVVLNAASDRSEVWILDAQALGEPVCRLALPGILPFGFHGTWRPAKQ